MNLSTLDHNVLTALHRAVVAFGRNWKSEVRQSWLSDRVPQGLYSSDHGWLRCLRNAPWGGFAFLDKVTTDAVAREWADRQRFPQSFPATR